MRKALNVIYNLNYKNQHAKLLKREIWSRDFGVFVPHRTNVFPKVEMQTSKQLHIYCFGESERC